MILWCRSWLQLKVKPKFFSVQTVSSVTRKVQNIVIGITI